MNLRNKNSKPRNFILQYKPKASKPNPEINYLPKLLKLKSKI